MTIQNDINKINLNLNAVKQKLSKLRGQKDSNYNPSYEGAVGAPETSTGKPLGDTLSNVSQPYSNTKRNKKIQTGTYFKGRKTGLSPIKASPVKHKIRRTTGTLAPQFRMGTRQNITGKIPKGGIHRRRKVKSGYGDPSAAYTQGNTGLLSNSTVLENTFVGLPVKDPTKQETYIRDNTKTKVDMNKITSTKVGDTINYFVNGQESHGIVAKMSNTFVTIFKEDGTFHDVHINDTFFVKDILINKTWNDMNIEERADILQKAKAYSPRYLGKSWEQLPRELQSILKEKDYKPKFGIQRCDQCDRAFEFPYELSDHKSKDHKAKSNLEQGAYGNIGGRPTAGISTQTEVDAEDEYEGQSHKRTAQDKEEFKLEDKKPKVD